MKSRKGPKLVYSHIYDRLDDQALYSLYMIRKFAVDEQLLKPAPDDLPDVDTKKLENRIRSALVRANNPSYTGRRLPDPDGTVKNRGRIEDAWYGATVKLFLVDQLPDEKARLEKMRCKLLTGKGARMPTWSKRSRVWLVAAFFAAIACGAPPVRDVIGTIYKDGIAAAHKLAYSQTPVTSDDLFQQAWVDYRAGAYEKAARKAHQIMSDDRISDHLRANCWYLLGSVDWEKGANRAALGHFQKAYDICDVIGDTSSLYAIAIAMSKALTFHGDLDASHDTLELAMEHYAAAKENIDHLGSFYLASMMLAAAQGDVAEAFRNATLQYEELKSGNQPDSIAQALSDLGFWYAAKGCTVKAQILTVEAENIIFRLQDETRHVYNQINWILIQRYQHVIPDPQAVSDIRRWARICNDSRADFYLDLALRMELKEYADESCMEEINLE